MNKKCVVLWCERSLPYWPEELGFMAPDGWTWVVRRNPYNPYGKPVITLESNNGKQRVNRIEVSFGLRYNNQEENHNG